MATVVKDSTDQSFDFDIRDTTGATMSVAYDTSGLKMYYRRGATGSATSVTPADLATIGTAHADGGIKEVSSSNMPGIHRTDWPDAAFAAGVDRVTLTVSGVTGMEPVSKEIELVVGVPVNGSNQPIVSIGDVETSGETPLQQVVEAGIVSEGSAPAAAGAASSAAASAASADGKLDDVDVKKINSSTVSGTGTEGDPWVGTGA